MQALEGFKELLLSTGKSSTLPTSVNTGRIGVEVKRVFEDAKQHLFDYIEAYYNRKRLHSELGHVYPEASELTNIVYWHSP